MTVAEQVPAGMRTKDPFREAVLTAARRFKSTWVELGKLLVKVQAEGLYQEWGHPTFEAYCAKEIRIRKATAQKLTRSYSFLERHEPQRTQEELLGRAPPFEVVEVLANAEQRGQLSDREYAKIRDSIWQPDKSTSELRRELEERFPHPKPAMGESEQLKRLANGAKRLAQELSCCQSVPASVAQRAERLASEVEALAQKADRSDQ